MNNGQITLAIILFLGICILGLWGCPQYKVYSLRKEGEAQLAHAQAQREVAVAEAKAKMEAASLLAQADTLRAHGIARSNQIIGESISQNYLNWFWIDELKSHQNQVIYVPSGQLGIPIQEATRLFNPVPDAPSTK